MRCGCLHVNPSLDVGFEGSDGMSNFEVRGCCIDRQGLWWAAAFG